MHINTWESFDLLCVSNRLVICQRIVHHRPTWSLVRYHCVSSCNVSTELFHHTPFLIEKKPILMQNSTHILIQWAVLLLQQVFPFTSVKRIIFTHLVSFLCSLLCAQSCLMHWREREPLWLGMSIRSYSVYLLCNAYRLTESKKIALQFWGWGKG